MEVSTKTRINLLVQKNGSYTAIVDKSKQSKRELSAMKQLSDDLGYAMVTVGPKVKQVRDLTACTCGSRERKSYCFGQFLCRNRSRKKFFAIKTW